MYPVRRGAGPARPQDVRGLRRPSGKPRRRDAGSPPRRRAVHPVRRARRRRRTVRGLPAGLPAGRTVARQRQPAGGAVTCSCGRRFPVDWAGEVCPACLLDRYTLPGGRITNAERAPIPGYPPARERYRVAGLCGRCGGERDRPDRRLCARCRELEVEATARHRAAHPPDREALQADVRRRRRERIAAGLCAECGGERDRPDRKLCARCRRRAADKQQALRDRAVKRRRLVVGTPGRLA